MTAPTVGMSKLTLFAASMPVMVPCIGEVSPRPAYEFDKLPSTAPSGEIVLALARDWLRGRAYEGQLEAVIAGCR